jgi:hypothetical protein
MNRDDGTGAVRSEGQTKQGGNSKWTLLVLAGSLALAAIVAIFLLTATDEVAPNRPAAVESPANPGSPASQPKTNP